MNFEHGLSSGFICLCQLDPFTHMKLGVRHFPLEYELYAYLEMDENCLVYLLSLQFRGNLIWCSKYCKNLAINRMIYLSRKIDIQEEHSWQQFFISRLLFCKNFWPGNFWTTRKAYLDWPFMQFNWKFFKIKTLLVQWIFF